MMINLIQNKSQFRTPFFQDNFEFNYVVCVSTLLVHSLACIANELESQQSTAPPDFLQLPQGSHTSDIPPYCLQYHSIHPPLIWFGGIELPRLVEMRVNLLGYLNCQKKNHGIHIIIQLTYIHNLQSMKAVCNSSTF